MHLLLSHHKKINEEDHYSLENIQSFTMFVMIQEKRKNISKKILKMLQVHNPKGIQKGYF